MIIRDCECVYDGIIRGEFDQTFIKTGLISIFLLPLAPQAKTTFSYGL